MIKTMIDAISIAINSAFGEGYEIYTEEVEQGLSEPCFFIFCLNPTKELFLGKRYFLQNLFCVQYLPATAEKWAECNAVLEKLLNCLEYIRIEGDLSRGTQMHSEYEAGVLSLFVNYDLFMNKLEAQTPIGELENAEIKVKG